MQSLAAAARLLDGASSTQGIEALLTQLGFQSPAIELTSEEAQSIGLTGKDGQFIIASGRGARRAIIFAVSSAVDLRAEVSRVASRLVSSSPHLLWSIAAFDCRDVAIAACEPAKSKARVVALVARRGEVVDSDSSTICALSAAEQDSDLLTHARWLEILGRESVSRRFFRALEQSVGKISRDLGPPTTETHELALLYTSRLLFLSFLETKGWLDGDHGFLANQYAACMGSGGGYHRRVLAPLFFGTLNTKMKNRSVRAAAFGRIPFLNGGLFARSQLERRYSKSYFSDEVLGDLFADVLTRYRFTAREDTTAWSEAAIDPEMLGRAFESLMSATTRKTSGAFYTPQSLVVNLSRTTLAHALSGPDISAECVGAALEGQRVSKRLADLLVTRLDGIRILDPACGSGAFLVHLLEEISALRQRLGDTRQLHDIRRALLTESIFGVDINPTAVWLCELRLWLCMAIENPERDPMRVPPLPNLDRHIRVGDSLLAESFGEGRAFVVPRKFASLRARYSRATGPRKRSLGKMLDKLERESAIAALHNLANGADCERRELVIASRSKDLFGKRIGSTGETRERLLGLKKRSRSARSAMRSASRGGALPFSFPAHFADTAAKGGFDIVIGNPPWVRTRNLEQRSRAELRRNYSVYRGAAWESGAGLSAAGKGFSAQVDVAALFVERSVSLAGEKGTIGLIVPSKLWRSLAGGGVRTLLQRRTSLLDIADLTDGLPEFDAAVYPSTIVARKERTESPATVAVEIHRNAGRTKWCTERLELPFDETPGSPWILLPPKVRKAFDRMTEAGAPLAGSAIGRPTLGVKSGCNEAFIASDGDVEPQMLRPLIRGENIAGWRLSQSSERIIWTHDENGRAMRSLDPQTLRRLTRFRRELEARSDSRGQSRWWSLFRTEAADCSRPRVIWADVARSPRAAVLFAGDKSVPLNSCYVVRCASNDDALTFAALLNSTIVAAWLNCLAEPARGGYHRYLGWTMSILPVPRNWERAKSILSPLAQSAIDGSHPTTTELNRATLCAYGISIEQAQPLLNWDTKQT